MKLLQSLDPRTPKEKVAAAVQQLQLLIDEAFGNIQVLKGDNEKVDLKKLSKLFQALNKNFGLGLNELGKQLATRRDVADVTAVLHVAIEGLTGALSGVPGGDKHMKGHIDSLKKTIADLDKQQVFNHFCELYEIEEGDRAMFRSTLSPSKPNILGTPVSVFHFVGCNDWVMRKYAPNGLPRGCYGVWSDTTLEFMYSTGAPPKFSNMKVGDYANGIEMLSGDWSKLIISVKMSGSMIKVDTQMGLDFLMSKNAMGTGTQIGEAQRILNSGLLTEHDLKTFRENGVSCVCIEMGSPKDQVHGYHTKGPWAFVVSMKHGVKRNPGKTDCRELTRSEICELLKKAGSKIQPAPHIELTGKAALEMFKYLKYHRNAVSNTELIRLLKEHNADIPAVMLDETVGKRPEGLVLDVEKRNDNNTLVNTIRIKLRFLSYLIATLVMRSFAKFKGDKGYGSSYTVENVPEFPEDPLFRILMDPQFCDFGADDILNVLAFLKLAWCNFRRIVSENPGNVYKSSDCAPWNEALDTADIDDLTKVLDEDDADNWWQLYSRIRNYPQMLHDMRAEADGKLKKIVSTEKTLLVFLQGISGSGKSTLARSHADDKWVVLEADQYVGNPQERHTAMQKELYISLRKGYRVIVSNTITTAWEMYVLLLIAMCAGLTLEEIDHCVLGEEMLKNLQHVKDLIYANMMVQYGRGDEAVPPNVIKMMGLRLMHSSIEGHFEQILRGTAYATRPKDSDKIPDIEHHNIDLFLKNKPNSRVYNMPQYEHPWMLTGKNNWLLVGTAFNDLRQHTVANIPTLAVQLDVPEWELVRACTTLTMERGPEMHLTLNSTAIQKTQCAPCDEEMQAQIMSILELTPLSLKDFMANKLKNENGDCTAFFWSLRTDHPLHTLIVEKIDKEHVGPHVTFGFNGGDVYPVPGTLRADGKRPKNPPPMIANLTQGGGHLC